MSVCEGGAGGEGKILSLHDVISALLWEDVEM